MSMPIPPHINFQEVNAGIDAVSVYTPVSTATGNNLTTITFFTEPKIHLDTIDLIGD